MGFSRYDFSVSKKLKTDMMYTKISKEMSSLDFGLDAFY
jgi:hypothetical protein